MKSQAILPLADAVDQAVTERPAQKKDRRKLRHQQWLQSMSMVASPVLSPLYFLPALFCHFLSHFINAASVVHPISWTTSVVFNLICSIQPFTLL